MSRASTSLYRLDRNRKTRWAKKGSAVRAGARTAILANRNSYIYRGILTKTRTGEPYLAGEGWSFIYILW